ncbi:MAG: ABC transporter permease, partial [Alphaproteobacteria bacterium]|nr:ABC transporter permease [Alphaproteobacteria bacterium]
MTDRPLASPSATPHYVNREPWDPYVWDTLTADQEKYYMAGQWKLMWWRFRRHRPAVISAAFLVLMYLSVLISEWIAPYDLQTRHIKYIFAPPQAVHFFHDGKFIGPFVYGLDMHRDMDTLQRVYVANHARPEPLRFFCEDEPYVFWGMIDGRFHLVCAAKGGTAFFLGTDRLGRDMLSRIVYAARVSLTIGVIGIVLSFTLALILGGLAGYYGGWVDLVVQRLTEILKSFPHLPLWLALSAALPVTWSPL